MPLKVWVAGVSELDYHPHPCGRPPTFPSVFGPLLWAACLYHKVQVVSVGSTVCGCDLVPPLTGDQGVHHAGPPFHKVTVTARP